MNISLIYPTQARRKGQQSSRGCWPPLGLAYLAAVLEEHGHKVQIIDRYILQEKNKFDLNKTNIETLNTISGFNTDMLGITATTPDIVDAIELFETVKESNNSIITVLGGPHVTAVAVETMQKCDNIDICVISEGENTISEIASWKELSQIRGICYKQDGRIVTTEPRPFIKNLDELPFPAWHLLDMDFYTRPSRFISRNSFLRATSIFTSRGCPFRCNFCAGPVIFPGVRFHSPERIADEIEKLTSDYSVEAVYFADDMFLANKRRAYEILRLFESRGIYKKLRWYAQIRSDFVDKELLAYMKRMGCDRVEFGFESGSERVLKLMNKKSSVEKNRQAVNITREAGLHFQGNFIIGYPNETEKDLNETVDFMKKSRPNIILMNIFWPLPGTVSYNQLKQAQKKLPAWEDTDRATETKLNYSQMADDKFFELYNRIKLKVVLPNNIYFLLKDSAFHPVTFFKLLRKHFGQYFKKISKLAMNSVTSKVHEMLRKSLWI